MILANIHDVHCAKKKSDILNIFFHFHPMSNDCLVLRSNNSIMIGVLITAS